LVVLLVILLTAPAPLSGHAFDTGRERKPCAMAAKTLEGSILVLLQPFLVWHNSCIKNSISVDDE